MRVMRRRTIVTFAVLVIIAAALFLYYGGRYLQHEDPLEKADAIFVLAGARIERCLEGADLLKAGYAPIVVLSPGRVESGEDYLSTHRVSFPREVDLQRSALIQLGAPPDAVLALSGTVDNTAGEAQLVAALAKARGWRTLIVVTSKYHTRRTGFAFRRVLEKSGVRIIVRATTYDRSDPARWWRKRGDFRFATSEWQKLIAYRIGLAD